MARIMTRSTNFRLTLLASALLIAGGSLLASRALADVPTPAPNPATAVTDTSLPLWLNKITLGGDLRLRGDRTFDKSPVAGSSDPVANDTEILRARLAMTAKITDQLTARFRLASADTNTITSSNTKLAGQEKKKGLYLDIASIDWTPIETVVVTGGKAANAFYVAGKNEAIFDSDVNLDGAQAKWSQELGSFKPFATVGHSVLSDNSATADVTLAAAQIGTQFKQDLVTANLAVAYYGFNNVKGTTASSFGQGASGNSTTTAGLFVNEYRVWDLEGDAWVDVAGLPLGAYGAWFQNTDPGDKNKAALGGLRVGRIKDVGSWAVDVSYRDVAADATLGTLADSDFGGGGTDVRGMKYVVQYMPLPSTTLAAVIYDNKRSVSSGAYGYERYQLEGVFSF